MSLSENPSLVWKEVLNTIRIFPSGSVFFVQKDVRREFERNDCAYAAECSDFVSITLLMIKEYFV